MPKGEYVCQYNGCGKSCMREDGCYRHSKIGRQNKREAMHVYKQSDTYKKRVAEKEMAKKAALEAEAERRFEEKKKQIIDEYRKSLKSRSIENKKKLIQNVEEPKLESDGESHPSSCSTCTSDSELSDTDQQPVTPSPNVSENPNQMVNVTNSYNEREISQIFEDLDSPNILGEEGED